MPAAELSRQAQEFLSWLAVERGRATNTVSAYRRDLAAYEEFLAGRGLAIPEVTEPVVEDYVAFLRAAGRKPSSTQNRCKARTATSARATDEGLRPAARRKAT